MITPAQHGRHTREWSLVCQAMGWRTNDDARRRAFYREFNLPESRKDWHPKHDFDEFLKACLKIRGIRDTRDRARESLLWRIREDARKAGLGEAYLKKISTDLYGLACWDELALDDLTNLRNAIHNRAVKRRRMTLDPAKKFQRSPVVAAAADPDPF